MRTRVVSLCATIATLAAGAESRGADAARGEYLASAGGCAVCHTADGKDAIPYAGGRAIETSFGVFYGPNITPHPQAGLGKWSARDFFRAMREGMRPDGDHYFPAFPFPSYTKISERDLHDLWAYLRSLPPSDRRNRPHELGILFSQRFAVGAWKQLYFTPGRFVADRAASVAVNRGAYLVQALGHCDACHTPRTALGGPRKDLFLAGAKTPDGVDAPDLTPAGLGKYSDEELMTLLATGVTPDGDVLAAEMDLVVRYTTGRLTREDRAAIVAYLHTLAPSPDAPSRARTVTRVSRPGNDSPHFMDIATRRDM